MTKHLQTHEYRVVQLRSSGEALALRASAINYIHSLALSTRSLRPIEHYCMDVLMHRRWSVSDSYRQPFQVRASTDAIKGSKSCTTPAMPPSLDAGQLAEQGYGLFAGCDSIRFRNSDMHHENASFGFYATESWRSAESARRHMNLPVFLNSFTHPCLACIASDIVVVLRMRDLLR